MTRREVLRFGVLLSLGSTAPLIGCAAPAASPTAAPAAPAAPTAGAAVAKPAEAPKPAAPGTAPTQAPAAPAKVPAPAAKVPTGRFLWATDPPPSRSPNPGTVGAPQGNQLYWPAFDGLTMVDRSGKAQPALASEWRAVSPTLYEFKLRQDVKFHDGTPLEASDVVGTFNYYLNPDNRLVIRTLYVGIKGVTSADRSTVQIELANPDPTFPKLVALALILPWRMVERMGPEPFFQKPIGTGPYRWTGVDFNTGLKFEAMPPDFVTPRGTAPVKDLEIKIVPEAATKAAGVRTGEIDGAYPLPGDIASSLRAAGFPISVDRGTSAVRFALDTYDGPTKDVRVRQALNYAVDKEAIIRTVVQGFGEPDGQLLGDEVFGYNPDVKPYPYDPARAKALLAEAGYANGFRIPLTGYLPSAGKDLCEAVAGFLSAVGVTAEINIIDSAARIPLAFGKPEGRKGLFGDISNWDATYEPNIVWQTFSSDRTLDTGRRWENAEFDRLFQAAKRELDDAKRADLYRQAGKVLRDDAGNLFLWRVHKPAATAKEFKWEPGYFADALVGKLTRTG